MSKALEQWSQGCKQKVRARVETLIKYFFSNHFYFSFVRLNGLVRLIVMLCSGPNSCCQQNLKCFDMFLLSSGLFS